MSLDDTQFCTHTDDGSLCADCLGTVEAEATVDEEKRLRFKAAMERHDKGIAEMKAVHEAKAQAEANYWRRYYNQDRLDELEAENAALREQVATLTAERDAAVEQLRRQAN